MPRPLRALRRVGGSLLRAAVLLGAVAAGAAGACADDVTAPDDGLGIVRGRWDGVAWVGRGYAVLTDDTLHLRAHRPGGPRGYEYQEQIWAQVPFRGADAYPLRSDDAVLAQVVGGDAGYFPRAEGELVITAHDTAAGRVRGRLRLAAVGGTFSWRFDDGQFDVPVYPSWSDVPPRARVR